jgi:hypothetical protein
VGGCTGMGSENGRSCGGAVIGLVPRSRPHPIVFPALAIIFAASFAACSRQGAPPSPDPATLLQSIAPADTSKYPPLQEAKHWSNPYLVVRTDRVGLLSGVAAYEEQILKPEEVLNALAQLPASAWPYGRAVAILVDQKPATAEPDKIALRRNRGIVEGELESAQVAIRWIPSS